VIAILTHRVELALDALVREKSVGEYHRSSHKGLFTSGREFMIVTEARDLEGKRLSDYRIIGWPEPKLVEMARARMIG
jgi:hypothetical protein